LGSCTQQNQKQFQASDSLSIEWTVQALCNVVDANFSHGCLSKGAGQLLNVSMEVLRSRKNQLRDLESLGTLFWFNTLGDQILRELTPNGTRISGI
jgi:hypothetical protein